MSKGLVGHKFLLGDKRRKVILNGCPIWVDGRIVIEVAEEATPTQEAHMLSEEPGSYMDLPVNG